MFARSVRLLRLLPAALAAGAVVFAASPAGAADPRDGVPLERASTAEPSRDRVVHLALSKSKILDFDEDVRDVLVADPKVADAVVRSSRRLYLIGNKFGTTNVVVFGANGRPVANLEIQVEIDTQALEGLLRRLMPKSTIRVEAVRGTVILSGQVANASDAIQAYEVASRFVGADSSLKSSSSSSSSGGSSSSGSSSDSAGSTVQVVNALTLGGKDQVALKVTIAEMNRDIIKKLGIDVAASGGTRWGGSVTQSSVFPITSGTTPNTYGATYNGGGWSVTAQLQALEQNSLMKTLAEPTLTALSGEQAQFLVGGEYPVPVNQATTNGQTTTTVEFKPYGIALNFQPVVLADDRINLTVKTEVSELTSEDSQTIGTLVVRGLKVRRASTTLEIPSGGAMVLGGLIKDDVKQALSGTPALMDVPILGSLFRSRDFQHSQTELVIFIQPIVVRPVAAAALQRPDQNFRASGDAAAVFMGRVNRLYRGNGQAPSGAYAGRPGYILD